MKQKDALGSTKNEIGKLGKAISSAISVRAHKAELRREHFDIALKSRDSCLELLYQGATYEEILATLKEAGIEINRRQLVVILAVEHPCHARARERIQADKERRRRRERERKKRVREEIEITSIRRRIRESGSVLSVKDDKAMDNPE